MAKGDRRQAAKIDGQQEATPTKPGKRKAESQPFDEISRVGPERKRGKRNQRVGTSGPKEPSEEPHLHEQRERPSSGAVVQDHLAPAPARKGKASTQLDAMPLATRSPGFPFMIGAHVSGAKGVHNAVTNAVHIGANAFAMFLKSQRKQAPLDRKLWYIEFVGKIHHCRTSIETNSMQTAWITGEFLNDFSKYLVNLAQEESEKAKQAYEAFLDDLKRCEALGIGLYNFHPGSTGGAPRKCAIERIAGALNRAHAATVRVTPLLEAMAGSGNVIGSSFEDLRDIISLIQDQSRIGVCIDTAHIFAAGYDLRSPSAFYATFEKFDKIVGLKYLKAFHLNDSKAPLGSNRDLHQNIGLGFLGLRAFHNIMNDDRFQNLPLVLETPIDSKNDEGKEMEDKAIWAKEIKLLEDLRGMDPDGDQYKSLESELARKGAAERKKFEEALMKKQAKTKKQETGQKKLSFKTK